MVVGGEIFQQHKILLADVSSSCARGLRSLAEYGIRAGGCAYIGALTP